MSGTRAVMDFVETPSHLFEQYAWDTNFFKTILAIDVHGNSISNELIHQLRQSRYELSSIERHNQIIYRYALFDQQNVWYTRFIT